jgi:hypothetical protein
MFNAQYMYRKIRGCDKSEKFYKFFWTKHGL